MEERRKTRQDRGGKKRKIDSQMEGGGKKGWKKEQIPQSQDRSKNLWKEQEKEGGRKKISF